MTVASAESPTAPVLETSDEDYRSFRRSYLVAFLCGGAADWLKGPYIYKLYEYRGFAPQEITVLFVAGYVSSAVFGLLAGSLCDALGRRRMCLVFCFLYTVHCLLHVFYSFWVLLLARAVSGVATALLFSAFEAWLVAEHGKRFSHRSIGDLFAVQTQGNAAAATLSGLVSQGSVYIGGYTAPFVMALPLLTCCAWQVCQWSENVGTQGQSLSSVAKVVWQSMTPSVMKVGMMQCLFEGALHIFIFLWTPCLQRGWPEVPHGLIFALYMICMSLGGRLFAVPAVRLSLGIVFLVGAWCLCMPTFTGEFWPNLACFCTFECCCGCYFPQIAMLRSRHFREEARGATISLFRVPLNVTVVLVLLYGRTLPPSAMLVFASSLLGVAAATFFSMPAAAVREKEP